MILEFRRKNTSTTVAALSGFESSRNLKLPISYKQFLLTINGGIPDDIVYPIYGMINNKYGGIQVFFGMGTLPPMPSIETIYDTYAGAIPKDIIPMADNGGGDYVCIDLRNGYERVVFWDKRPFWGTGKWRETDLYHVADSFAGFLTSLRPSFY